MKRIPFPRRPITYKFKRPHSKAEEPDPATAGFRRNPPPIMIATQSPRGVRVAAGSGSAPEGPLPWRESLWLGEG